MHDDLETRRLAALRDLEVLDTAAEERFDRIVRVVARTLDVPIALVSLVDADRQWFKAKRGLDADETPRDIAFCHHAIRGPEVFEVADAAADPRFRDNPLVTSPPSIQFYAGAPLTLRGGERVGTLCAIDRRPRTLTEAQRATLQDLAAVVVDELYLRRQMREAAAIGAELDERRRELQHANEALEQFAHVASHDLRAPLKSLVNLVDLVCLDGEETDELAMIRGCAERMEALVDGYRRLSKLRVEPEQVGATSARELVEAVAADVEVAVRVEGDAVLRADPVLLRQLFVNLLANVARYGSEPEATVRVRAHGDAVELRVDNPVEGSLDVDASVFTPFRRLHSSGDGTGLGLAIVHRVASLHDAAVEAGSEAGRFHVTLRWPGAAA